MSDEGQMNLPTVDTSAVKPRPSAQLPEAINKDIEAYVEARIKAALDRFAYQFELSRRRRLGPHE